MVVQDSLEAAYTVTERVARARDVASVCQVVVDAIPDLLPARRSAVLLLDAEGVMRFVVSQGLSEEYRRLVEGHSPWDPEEPDPRPVLVADAAREESLAALRGALTGEGIGALAFVPLVNEGRLLGKFMVYFDQPHTMSASELMLAKLLAAQAAFAIARLRAQAAADEARAELAAVLESVPDGIVVHGPDRRIRFVNDVMMSFGPKVERAVGQSSQAYADRVELFDESGGPLNLPDLPQQRALTTGQPVTAVYGIRVKGETDIRGLRMSTRPVSGPDGKLRFSVGVAHDVTAERREADARKFLLEAGAILGGSLDYEATLRSVARLAVPRLADWCSVEVVGEDGVPRTVAVEHSDPAQIALVQKLAEAYPADPDSPTGAPNVRRTGLPEVYNDIPEAMLAAVARDEEHLRLIRRLGLRAVMVVPMKLRGRVLGVISFASSETARTFGPEDLAMATQLADRAAVAVENARLYGEARAANGRLQLALEAGKLGTWEYDPASGRFAWSAALAAVHGTTVEALEPTLEGYIGTIHPDDAEGARASIASALASSGYHRREYRIVLPDGRVRWVEARGVVDREASGEVRMRGVRVDITERKLAEARLAEERERLEVTLSSIGDAVIATDRKGRVTMLNAVASQLTGWGAEDAAGRPLTEVFEIYSEKTGLPVPNPVEAVLETGKIVGLANHTELQARDGTRRAIADSAAPIRSGDGSIVGVVLVFRDVTQEQRLERELARASKLESIGVLAGGIAHDFNNILTAISANVSLAERRVGNEHPAHGRLVAAQIACERARDLTRQLLTFSRGGAPIRSSTSVEALLRESCGFALQGSSVRAHFELPADLWPVDADAGQISQVIHNIALNAAQAMPDGGNLWTSADNEIIAEPGWVPLPRGNYVRIRFSDDGPGISPDDLTRVFDPFFTTKPTGSGLGLATAYSIVKRHDGHMAVESLVGEGTTFTVYLPVASRAPEAPAKAPPAPRGKGRVLVMDDDSAIRELAKECLSYLGYESATAADGDEAFEKYAQAEAEGRPFDVVMLDLTVPGGVGGRETIKRLRERFPAVRAIVSSGYSNDPIMGSFRDHGFAGVLQKPFSVDDLGRILQEVTGHSR
jgi:PAS domain S-box-containing protein